MKTKTLFLTLFAGAILCFSNVSNAQYHASGNTGNSSSGSSGDGVDGQNMIGVGVGFLGGFGGLTVGGYNVSSSPNIILIYDRGINEHIAIGAQLGYQTVTWNYTTQDINPNTFAYENYTESWKWTLISFMVRGTYHFTVNEKFDPFVGVGLGYNSINFKYTTDDPYYGTSYYSTPTYNYSGVAYGFFVGAHYYFTDHIGVWGQLGYMGYASGFLSLGLQFKL